MIHRIKTCYKNAVFVRDDLICKKCGRRIGGRYVIDGREYLFVFHVKYRYLLPSYSDIPELAKPSNSMRIDYDDMDREILDELGKEFDIAVEEDDGEEDEIEPEILTFDDDKEEDEDEHL